MISAKSSISLKKQDLSNQKIPIVGINNLYFAHQASAGDTGFNLATLTTPSSSMPSFTQPSQSQLLGANLLFFQKNLILTSSLRGQLIKDLSYQVVSNTQINFLNFTAQSGEIFTGIINSASTNGNRIVSTAISPVTGTLAAGVTDFPVGTPFIAGAFSSAQVGQVMVFLDGVQQYRNTGNSSTTLDGNYYEVDPGSGTSNLIRFNVVDPNNARSVTVIYTNAVAEKPDGAQSAQIEAMQGQINQMIPVLADAAGVAQSTFRTAPTYQDLKQFGDTVNTINTNTGSAAGASQTGYVTTGTQTFGGRKTMSNSKVRVGRAANQSIPNNTDTKIQFDTKVFDTNSEFDASTNYRFQPTVAGYYQIYAQAVYVSSVNSGSAMQLWLRQNGVTPVAYCLGAQPITGGGNYTLSINTIIQLNGTTDYLEVMTYQNSGGAINLYGDTKYTMATFYQLP